MDLGVQEIIIIVVVIIVLFGVVKMVGDKRYLRRSGGSRGADKNKSDEGKA